MDIDHIIQMNIGLGGLPPNWMAAPTQKTFPIERRRPVSRVVCDGFGKSGTGSK